MFGGCMLMALAVACLGLQVGVVEPFPPLNSTWVVTGLLLAVLLMLGNWALQFGAARLAAGTTALVMLSEVMFASVSSALLGTSTLSTRTVMGGALILLASLLAALQFRRPGATAH
jgi:drug/metabolite transporter (DMT)-like permease